MKRLIRVARIRRWRNTFEKEFFRRRRMCLSSGVLCWDVGEGLMTRLRRSIKILGSSKELSETRLSPSTSDYLLMLWCDLD